MSLVWLYCVTRAPAAAVGGIEGAPVRSIEEAGLVAAVSDVPEEHYDQPALDEHVRDGEWLTPRATAHQSVNAAVHRAAEAALPVPFGTIFRSDERVREMLRARADELRAKLESVRGSAEWVVGLYRDMVVAAGALAAGGSKKAALEKREPVAAGAGRRYLEGRKVEGERHAELRRLDEEAAAAAEQALARVSKQRYAEPIADRDADLVARATYLVRASDEGRMRDAMHGFNTDWNDRGYELRATGPWPPYRTAA